MATDLRQQTRDLFAQIDAAQEVIAISEVLERAEPQEANAKGAQEIPTIPVRWSARPRRQVAWAVAIAAAVVTLVLVGGLALVTRGGAGTDPAGPGRTTISQPPESNTTTAPDLQTLGWSWAAAEWTEGADGPWIRTIVATPSGFLGTSRSGSLFASADGLSWSLAATPVPLGGVSVVDGGDHLLMAGTRSSDGTPTLWRSEDGESWTEIDASGIGDFELHASTPSGLAWLGSVVAVVDSNRLGQAHIPPWGDIPGGVAIVELGRRVLAFGSVHPEFGRPSGRVWIYMGDGAWTEPVTIPYSEGHAVVGNTALMFDITEREVGGSAEPGVTQWPLLASRDGLVWTEIDVVEAEQVFGMQIDAGDSFWIYGPIGGGGSDLGAFRGGYIRISVDGQTWEELDLPSREVIRIAGDTIFIGPDHENAADLSYWRGTLSDL